MVSAATTVVPACRTLVVEDEPAAAEALAEMARRAGHQVVSSRTLAGALVMLGAWAPQCVLLDLALPDGDGADVLRHLRRHAAGASPVRVAIVSGHLGDDGGFQAVALGPDACFAKPVDADALRRWLAEEAPPPAAPVV